MTTKEIRLFRTLFVGAAIWNLMGGIIGYFNPEHAFQMLFARELSDPLYHDIYRGACGTTLIYFVGYSVVAYAPLRHTGIVLVGGIGKIGFALQLLKFYLGGVATSHALVVIVGDLVFSIAFLHYYWRLYRTGRPVFGASASRDLAPPQTEDGGPLRSTDPV